MYVLCQLTETSKVHGLQYWMPPEKTCNHTAGYPLEIARHPILKVKCKHFALPLEPFYA